MEKSSFVDRPLVNTTPDMVYAVQERASVSATILLQPDPRSLPGRVAQKASQGDPVPIIGKLVKPDRTLKWNTAELLWDVRNGRRYTQLEIGADQDRSYIFSLATTSTTSFDILIKDVSADQTFGGLSLSSASPLISPVIEGQFAILEISAPVGAPFNGEIQVAEVAYLDFPTRHATVGRAVGDSASCQIDANCHATDAKLAAAMNGVMKLVITRADGSVGECSGSLLNSNRKRPNSNLPYTHILTAAHCLSDADNEGHLYLDPPRSVNAFFFYRSSACNSGTPSTGTRQVALSNFVQGNPNIRPMVPSGDVLPQQLYADQVILSYTEFPPSGARYLSYWPFAHTVGFGFEPDGGYLHVLHHPQGDLLKVATGGVTAHVTATFVGKGLRTLATGPAGDFSEMTFFDGDSEPGSSGAPVLARIDFPPSSDYDYYLVGSMSASPEGSCGLSRTATFGRLDGPVVQSGVAGTGRGALTRENFPTYPGSFRWILALDDTQPNVGIPSVFRAIGNVGNEYFSELTFINTNPYIWDSESRNYVTRSIHGTVNFQSVEAETSIGRETTQAIEFQTLGATLLDFRVESVNATGIHLPRPTTNDFSIRSNSCNRADGLIVTHCSLMLVFHPQGAATDPVREGFLTVRGAFAGAPYVLRLYGKVKAAPVAESPVIEYVNSVNFPNDPGGHFFYTNDPAEIQYVDSGGAGGFVRTGKQFRAGGSKQLCRFYGSVSPGPNSHFFTIADSECEYLRSLQVTPRPTTVQQWNYEGLAFSETPPITDSNGVPVGCPGGTIPVYRYYNNAYRNGIKNSWASNHRYGTDKFALDAFAGTNNWAAEGIAFCALQ
jgi:hypothetical protein